MFKLISCSVLALPLLVLDHFIRLSAQMGEGLVGELGELDGNGGAHVLDMDH